MTEHKHGCLSCTPDMVPAFTVDDERYHDYKKCGATLRALVGGSDIGYTRGVFGGPEGWALAAGQTIEDIHQCPCKPDAESTPCVTPVFGAVVVAHDCPARLAAEVDRLKAALRPLVSDDVYWRAVFGRDVL